MPNPSRTRPQPRATPEAAPASRALPLALLVLALAGVGVAIDLWLIHERAKAGGSAFCDVNATVSCTDVARSKYSVFLGVPIAAWGALVYLAMAGLAASALGRKRPGASWPGGLLFVLAAFMSAGALVLAYISHVQLDRFCIMCAVSWAISFGLLALTIPLVRRAGGVGAALAADRGDVDPVRAGGGGLGLADRVEGVDLAGHQRAVASLGEGERSHPPVRDSQHQHPRRITTGETGRALQQGGEAGGEALAVQPAVLVVDPGQQADQRVVARYRRAGMFGVDARIQLGGGPAGGGDDPRRRQVHALRAQGRGQLHRPASVFRDAFADGVRVAQGEERLRHAYAAAFRDLIGTTLVAASARRARARSMRWNTSRISSAWGSRVTRKWSR